jgi:adenosylcobinamide-phosphate synthase
MLISMLPVTLRGDLAILLAALLLDAVLGDPPALWRRLPHPVVLIGWVISRLDHRLNRDSCSRRDLRWRGALVALGLAAAALGLGAAVTALRLHWRWGWILELLLTWTLLAQNSLFQHVRAVAVALRQGGLAGGRWAVSRIVGRDPNSLDSHGVARAAIESSAENFADGVVAPALWYILAGFPGILLYKTVNTADSMIGHLTPRHRDFGMASARLDDLLNLLPARLAAALLALAMLFVPTARPWQAWRVMWRDHGHHRSPNAGWPESAMAGGLDLALAGPRRYVGHNVDDPWIGDGRARATVADIHRALACLVVGCLLLFGLVLLLLLLPALLRSGGLPW